MLIGRARGQSDANRGLEPTPFEQSPRRRQRAARLTRIPLAGKKREMRVFHFPDASSFLRRAQRWLMGAEIENNLILGICDQMLASGQPTPDVYLGTVEAADAVVACALRTPPH